MHFMYYNFVRIDLKLRMTPAMAAGVTLWEVADIVALLEAKEAEKPTCAGRTRSVRIDIRFPFPGDESMAIAGWVLIGMGALQIIYGSVLVAYQMANRPPPMGHHLVFNFIGTKFGGKSAYPGIVIIVVGAVLLLAGALISN
jgi:hypothetical protein